MKALTVHQPWAQLLALGVKQFETRSWYTHFRGPLAIHASKQQASFVSAIVLQRLGKVLFPYGFRALQDLPFGCVVGVGMLEDVQPAELISAQAIAGEKDFGDFRPGRFAWKFSQVRVLEKPIPACGHQGIWNLPEELIL
ncbi:ASCH domain-containing protein [Candidatus Nitronereus thalassa]|uniref:ASCH domain-containing protein n=1 Tax=Candidatus Nitronereus thalassa TaxID=3020898 RepID=A0ABU3K395_9BACT|nr:ASCH domain-containing protein [Candidatus Nitronereus thalassa]MDT7040862.1 ASCH domain-containing protein [Candidatus Nitronereus thalassa]